MVRIFDEKTSEIGFDCAEIKAKYPTLVLDTFQLAAITAIREGHHPLVTAHTGSGKTLPAEYAIEYFIREKGKKVIYTAPIKSLSNQKFHEFKAKFPAISFGILTGDIKFNPDADCVIMTTEILRNSLAEGGFSDAVGCVVFDEVHYINDAARGKVWEECIMWLPANVTMVMLSATIDRVRQFAEWIESIKNKGGPKPAEEVWICSTGKRVVPLIHYTFMTSNSGDLRGLNKEERDFVNGFIDTPKTIKNPDGSFVERNIVDTFRVAKLISDDSVKRSTVIHRAVSYLNERDMLPGICFIFSRKKANDMARQLGIDLLSGKRLSATVSHEVLTILRRLPNWEEYVRTAEYEEMIELMQRGIAVHHSGVIPVLREIVEIMFSKGYIKMLFATETFAVGVNMPTKTVLFTDIQKYAESQFRFLHPHEYTQMAGRAGRRGLDKVGHVIHLFNLYDSVGAIGQNTLKTILAGAPQTLRSKYAIGYDTILNVAANGDKDVVEGSLQVALNSMIRYEINAALDDIDRQLVEKRAKIGRECQLSELQNKLVDEYEVRTKAIETANKKHRNRLNDELKEFIEQAKRKNGTDINKILQKKKELVAMANECDELEIERLRVQEQLGNDVMTTYCDLERNGIIHDGVLSHIGLAARCFKEVDCLSWSVVLERNRELFEALSVSEFVGFLSMFAYDKGEEDDVCVNIDNENILKLIELFGEFQVELRREKWVFFADWCDAVDDTQCKQVIVNSGLYAGEFVKTMLKINNICSEIDDACLVYGYTGLASKVNKVADATLKSIVTPQSLYL
jgi:superfamily II RNA helicase